MNILFFVPEPTSGGAEKTIENIIVYFEKFYPDYNCYECVMQEDNCKNKPNYLYVLKHDCHKIRGGLKKFFFKILQINDLRKLKRKLDIDICVSFLIGADIVNELSKRNDKVIFSLRNNPHDMLVNLSKFESNLYKYLIKRADGVVSLSKSVEKEAIKIFNIKPEKICTIYNPVPIKKYLKEPCRVAEIRKKHEKVIITAGRLTHQKGQWHLIKAIAALKQKGEDVALIILGTGEMETQLLEFAEQLEVSKLIYFEGFVNNVYDYINYSDVFVFSSLYEGLGNVLIETLALGKTIISSDCKYGPRELLAPGTEIKKLKSPEFAEYGILVPVGNDVVSLEIEDADIILASAIERALVDDSIRINYENKALERAQDFEPLKIITQWKTLFDS